MTTEEFAAGAPPGDAPMTSSAWSPLRPREAGVHRGQWRSADPLHRVSRTHASSDSAVPQEAFHVVA
jgi:hypothetical protein